MKTIRNLMMGLMLLILASFTKPISSNSANTTNSRTLIEKVGLPVAAKQFGFKYFYDPNTFYTSFVYYNSGGTYYLQVVCLRVDGSGVLNPFPAPTALTVNVTANYVYGGTPGSQTGNRVIPSGGQAFYVGSYAFSAVPTLITNSVSPTIVPSGIYAGYPVQTLQYPADF